jgi:AbrB family looped-hinge helix DNA binding protein
MAPPDRPTTILSTKGQVILPKAIRDQHRWSAGTRLLVEDTQDGVLLKAAPIFPPTLPEDVFGSLGYAGEPKSLEEMDAGITAEAKRRHDRDRH